MVAPTADVTIQKERKSGVPHKKRRKEGEPSEKKASLNSRNKPSGEKDASRVYKQANAPHRREKELSAVRREKHPRLGLI